MSLVDAPTLTRSAHPARTAVLPSEAYVLALAQLSSHYAASSSAPTNKIYLYDKSDLGPSGQLAGHEGAITAMRAVPRFAGTAAPTLVSCGKDGLVKVWDERSGSVGLQMPAIAGGRTRALLCCDVSGDGMTVAAGTDLQGEDAVLLYWDPRNPAAPLRTHTYTHSDDITAVHFLRSRPSNSTRNVLLSISSDGLLSTSNADEPDEDEACMQVGNWGCSIAQAGWIHGRGGSPAVWASSDMETFSVWTGELDPVQDLDIRQPSIHKQDYTWVTDYLIGCHNNLTVPDDRDNDLALFLGSNEGDIALVTRSTFTDTNVPWKLERLWTGAHVGVVRSVLWDERNNVLLTGGEDSKLNVWSSPPLSASTSGGAKRETDAMEVDEDQIPNRKRRRS